MAAALKPVPTVTTHYKEGPNVHEEDTAVALFGQLNLKKHRVKNGRRRPSNHRR
jgi:hypothetical protein